MDLAPVPEVFRGSFRVPNLALESIMACRVFRHLKIGVITEEGYTMGSITLHSSHRTAVVSSKDHVLRMDALKDTPRSPVVIEIAKAMKTNGDDQYEKKPGYWEEVSSRLGLNRV
jgi:hypothetical protein